MAKATLMEEKFSISLLKNILPKKDGQTRDVVFGLIMKEDQTPEEVILNFVHHARTLCHSFPYADGTVYISYFSFQFSIDFPSELIDLLNITQWKLELTVND